MSVRGHRTLPHSGYYGGGPPVHRTPNHTPTGSRKGRGGAGPWTSISMRESPFRGGGGRVRSGTPPSRLKNCARSLATFMCTQVGVGGIIVGYAFVGAAAFMALEGDLEANPSGDDDVKNISVLREEMGRSLCSLRIKQFSEEDWHSAANHSLLHFQEMVVEAVKLRGYDGHRLVEKWTLPATLMFTLSIFTMIGFGNLVPRTDWGRVLTIAYAVVGIPLYVLYFMNMGRALAKAFKWLYLKLNSISIRGESEMEFGSSSGGGPPGQILVPSSASLYVLLSYIGVGTIMFAEWEGWGYLDSVYFCVISLCKIGLGDFVPGASIDENKADLSEAERMDQRQQNQIKFVANFIYLLLGLGLVAMCYNLLREEVLAKAQRLRADAKDLCLFLKRECDCSGGDK